MMIFHRFLGLFTNGLAFQEINPWLGIRYKVSGKMGHL
jgi:hypothetical protein